jgi:alanyl aminopeptidase
MRTRLYREQNPLLRRHLLRALSSAIDDDGAAFARALAIDERMRTNEWYVPGVVLMKDARTRDDTWRWVKDKWPRFVQRVPEMERGYLPYAGQGLCTEQDAADVEAFFAPKLAELFGGERVLAQVAEGIRLCAALRAHHAEDARKLFAAP